jgi:outer membrane lipoprotein-sorting protein
MKLKSRLTPFVRMMFVALISLPTIATAQSQSKPSHSVAKAGGNDPFDSFKTFSATLNGGMGNDHDRKIYRSGNLMRFDFENSYRITDLDKRITWGVDPHSCTKLDAPDAASFPFSAYRDFEVKRSLTTETETIDGHPCVIENVTFTPTDGRPVIVTMKLWEATDLEHFPLKIEVEPSGPMVKSGSKFSISYTNVSLNPPSSTLFKHPAECTGATPASPIPQAAPKR